MQQTQEQQRATLTNPDKYLSLEEIQHGSHLYPSLLIDINRLSCTPDLETISGKEGLQIRNTAQEQDNHPYLGNIQYRQALALLLPLNRVFPNPRLFVDFLNAVNQGRQEQKTVYDVAHDQIGAPRLQKVWDEITEQRYPWRGEHLNNLYFNQKTS